MKLIILLAGRTPVALRFIFADHVVVAGAKVQVWELVLSEDSIGFNKIMTKLSEA